MLVLKTNYSIRVSLLRFKSSFLNKSAGIPLVPYSDNRAPSALMDYKRFGEKNAWGTLPSRAYKHKRGGKALLVCF